ncbi:MAG: hypothetical protein IAG10_34765 [Planctomycetaceae bacterium]|nr:hypothetical protein [Planctomycetaceae bacterium]
MSDPQTSRPEFPIVPALVVSSLLGGLIALGLSGLWRFAFPEPLNRPEPTATTAAFVEFLPPLTPPEQRIEEALEKSAECEFTDAPLVDVVAFFAEFASIKMVIDYEALTEEGIASDTPVTRKLNDLRLRSVLHLILDPLQLTAIPKHDVLLITTSAKAREYLMTRTYPVSDLCLDPESLSLDFASLIRAIEEETSGPWMTRDGEGGTITESTPTGILLVRQTYQLHRDVLELLQNLRTAKRFNLLDAGKDAFQKWDQQRAVAVASLLKPPAGPVEFVEVIGTTQSEAERLIEKALDKTVTINFQDTPLNKVVAFFAKQLSINVLLDNQSLIDEGIASAKPVTLQLQQITARSALELLLQPLGLGTAIDNEVLVVLSTAREMERLVGRTYPVSDLIGPNEDYGSLIRMLEFSTSGTWLTTHGEGGAITEISTAGSLVVRQTSAVQRQVLSLLRQQREAQQRMLPMKPGKPLPNRR